MKIGNKVIRPEYLETEEGIKILSDYEAKWYKEVAEYLYKGDGFNTNSIVGRYREHNQKFMQKNSNQPGAFLLNDVWLNIPPQAISVKYQNHDIDIPQLRSKHSVKLATGYGEVSVSVDIVLSEDMLNGITLDDEINYKLIPILTQIRNMPFVYVENEYLRDKIVDVAKKLSDDKNMSVSSDADIMLTYVSHSISTLEDTPSALKLSLNFLLFNYLPYIKQVAFVQDFDRLKSGVIKTDESTGKILSAVGPVYEPSKSFAFYEFHAKEFKRIQELVNDHYRHRYDNQELEFTYYTYLEVERQYLDDDFKKKLDQAKKVTEFTKTLGGKTSALKNYSSLYDAAFDALMKEEGYYADDPDDKGGKTYMGIASKYYQSDFNNIMALQDVESQREYAKAFYYRKFWSPDFDNLSDKKLAIAVFVFCVNAGMTRGLQILDQAVGLDTVDSPGVYGRFVEEMIAFYRTRDTFWKHGKGWIKRAKRDYSKYVNRIQDDKAPSLAITEVELQKQMDAVQAKYDQDNSMFGKDFSTPEDFDNKKTASEEDVELSIVQQKVKEYIESLGEDNYEFVVPTEGSATAFIRIKNSYNTNINLTSGLTLATIQSLGGQDVPRIPISGYKYATHQYMGGHIEKASLQFVISDHSGDRILENMQTIFNTASTNSLKYRSVAALDGVGIKNELLNAITGSQWFTVDSVDISTHPQIPGGSIVDITLTDYSRVKEHLWKAFGFEMDNKKHERDLLQKMFDEFIDYVQPTASVVGPKNDWLSNFNTVSSRNKSRDYTVDTLILDSVTKKSSAIKSEMQKMVGKFITEINEETPINIRMIDGYGLQNHIKTPESKDFFSKEGSEKLNRAIKKFLLTNFDDLKKLLPKFDSIYSDDVLKELEVVATAAYLDFDLPPTIDPDYFFYQSNKYANVEQKIKDLFANELKPEEVEERYNKYVDQLRAHDLESWDDQKKENNIIHRLTGKVEGFDDNKDKFITKAKDDRPAYTATNLSVENNRISKYDERHHDKYIGMSDLGKNVEKDGNRGSLNAELKKSLRYGDGPNFVKALYKMKALDNTVEQSNFDMSNAFPTYKVYIIEEDDQDLSAPIRTDLNELYGLNAIQEIRLVQHDDQPADLLSINFLDLSGRFTSAKFKDKPWLETKDLDKRDTELENPLKGLMLKEGTRIQLRTGYSNNVNELEVMFNGQVVSVDGELNQYSMICQSFGTELAFEKKGVGNAFDPTSFNAETKELISWAINQPEVKHFGRWKLRDASNLQQSESEVGVAPGSYIRMRADGSEQRVWTWTKDQSDLNVLAPDESNFSAISSHHNFDDGLWSIWTNFTGIFEDIFNWGTNYYVNGQTPWEVIDEMTYRYPGYVARVVPYGERNTLFFGPPDAPYFYRPLYFNESNEIRSYIKEHKAELEKATETLEEIQTNLRKEIDNFVNSDGTVKDVYIGAYNSTAKDYVERRIKRAEKAAKPYLDTIAPYHELRQRSIRPFRRTWVATSENSIVKNKIKADYRDVYNEITIVHSGTDAQEPKDWDDKKETTLKMNDFLQDEDVRTATKMFPNCINKNGDGTMGGAHRYAAHELQRQAKKLYKGTLTLIGNPLIKPTDQILVFDDHTQTYGPIEVREHVLSIAPGQGMLSAITPGMVSSINDLVAMSTWDAMHHFLAKGRGIDLMSHVAGGIVPTVLGAGGAMTAIGAIGLPAAGLALSPLGILTAVGIGGLMTSLAIKSINLAQYREPIFLHPLMRNGVPYMHGMNTYRTGGLMEWAENEWKLFTDGLETYYDVVSSAVDELLSKT